MTQPLKKENARLGTLTKQRSDMNKHILTFIAILVGSFMLCGIIDLVFNPDYHTSWDESIQVPPAFNNPWLPAAIVGLGAGIGETFILMLQHYGKINIDNSEARK